MIGPFLDDATYQVMLNCSHNTPLSLLRADGFRSGRCRPGNGEPSELLTMLRLLPIVYLSIY